MNQECLVKPGQVYTQSEMDAILRGEDVERRKPCGAEQNDKDARCGGREKTFGRVLSQKEVDDLLYGLSGGLYKRED